jgi:hypothetical protein
MAVAFGLAVSIGCAAGEKPPRAGEPAETARTCDGVLRLVDAAVAEARAGDAASARVAGFPHLRANRFLADLWPGLESPDARADALEWMRQLDREAREREIRNLPGPALEKLAARLGTGADRATVFGRADGCAQEMAGRDRENPPAAHRLARALDVPEEYSLALQIAGLYPFAALPVLGLTVRGQEAFRAWHREPYERLPWRGGPRVYRPPAAPAYSAEAAAAILLRAVQNPLRVPRPPSGDAEALFAMFAPVIVQDESGGDDRIGAVAWGRGRPEVDAGPPAIYTFLSHGRRRGAPVLQLNYVLWYPARSGPDAPWIERGPLDGLTLRLSLAADGAPFMLELMNNCGCYHFFVPRRETIRGVRRAPNELAPFVPRFLPEDFPRERLRLRVKSGWHQVDHIGSDGPGESAEFRGYRLRPYAELESLPAGGGDFESLFDPSGIAKGSDRIEPLILFPMGVPRVGSMRQRGHHAILFIGRAHFDDPALFDRYFDWN